MSLYIIEQLVRQGRVTTKCMPVRFFFNTFLKLFLILASKVFLYLTLLAAPHARERYFNFAAPHVEERQCCWGGSGVKVAGAAAPQIKERQRARTIF
jgi:hypothetical protein